MNKNGSAISGRVPRTISTETYFQIVRDELERCGRAYVRVTGTSMWPLLRHLQDGVVLVPPQNIKPGEIVLFDRKNGRYALHRVVRTDKDGFVMMGDHQWHIEKCLPYGQVVGVVRIICRGEREIPVSALRIRAYALLMRVTAFPRAYGHTALSRIAKIFKHR